MIKDYTPKYLEQTAVNISRGSKLLARIPLATRIVAGNRNVPKGWELLTAPTSSIKEWVDDYVAPAHTVPLPFPRLFTMAGVLSVSAAELDVLEAEHGDVQHAVAQAYGGNVIVGALDPALRFAIDDSDDTRRLGAFKINDYAPMACGGVWHAESKQFYAATSYFGGQMAVRSLVQQGVPVA